MKASHSYCFDSFNCEARATFYDESLSNLPMCVVELLPCELKCGIRPEQYHQFSYLRNSLSLQQRFDTLLHRRPPQRPSRSNNQATRDWWKYIISCVMTRPRSRPWHDIVRIVECRKSYIHLVVKKLENRANGSGFHRGLSHNETVRLSDIEAFLPIEVLLSFHLIALRQLVTKKEVDKSENNEIKRRQYSLSRFRALFSVKIKAECYV